MKQRIVEVKDVRCVERRVWLPIECPFERAAADSTLVRARVDVAHMTRCDSTSSLSHLLLLALDQTSGEVGWSEADG